MGFKKQDSYKPALTQATNVQQNTQQKKKNINTTFFAILFSLHWFFFLGKNQRVICQFVSRPSSQLPRTPAETKLSARTRVSSSNSSFNSSEILVSNAALLVRLCLWCGEVLDSCQPSHCWFVVPVVISSTPTTCFLCSIWILSHWTLMSGLKC